MIAPGTASRADTTATVTDGFVQRIHHSSQ